MAFSGSRLAWSDLPRSVRDTIARLAGAEVVAEGPATTGFSPGYASLLELGDGTEVFVKAVSPEQNPDSPELARAEIRALGLLPPQVPAPRLTWSFDDGTWVVLGTQAVPGRCPDYPWRPAQLAQVLDLVDELANTGTPAPERLPSLTPTLRTLAGHGRRLAENPADLASAVDAAGPNGPWLRDHLADLITWADQAAVLATGQTLAHNDLRVDNILLGERDAWLVDWPHAAKDAPRWFDLAGLLPGIAMQGGGDPDELFWSHPVAAGAERAAVRAVVAMLVGYFMQSAVQPAPPGIANLRAFQLAHGVAALEWLRRF
jgi:aminoglycoside phosphotransferase (APT) family kinase protein